MRLTDVSSVCICEISRNKLIMNLKRYLRQKLCSLVNKNYHKQHSFWCPECWKLHFLAFKFQIFLGEHAPRPTQWKGALRPPLLSQPLVKRPLRAQFLWVCRRDKPTWVRLVICKPFLVFSHHSSKPTENALYYIYKTIVSSSNFLWVYHHNNPYVFDQSERT